MLRRPLTNIELKLDDIREYEYMRQQKAKDQEKQMKSFTDTPGGWPGGPKTKEEIYSRIGYVPDKANQGSTPARPNLL